jgi:ATP-dependent Lhr-like helicase
MVAAAAPPRIGGGRSLRADTRRLSLSQSAALEDFDATLTMLSEGIRRAARTLRCLLFRDRVNHRLRAPARQPSRGDHQRRRHSGKCALHGCGHARRMPRCRHRGRRFRRRKPLAGDIMLLGNSSWRIRRVERGRVLVEDAHGAPPNVPVLARRSARTHPELSAATCPNCAKQSASC